MRKRLLCLLMVFTLLALQLPLSLPASATENVASESTEPEQWGISRSETPIKHEQGDTAGLSVKSQHPAIAEKNALWNTEAERILIENLNADSATLQQISGVGPVTAEKIIAYRDQNGGFKNIEQLKEISGIGDKTFEKMKDQVSL